MGRVVLLIGRFQPLHLGHISLLEQCVADVHISRLLVVIGSAQQEVSFANPFSVAERKKMLLDLGLVDEKDFFVVPDFPTDSEWLNFLFDQLPSFDAVITGNPRVQGLFCKTHDIIEPDLSIWPISATALRDYLVQGSWDELQSWLDPSTLHYLRDIDAVSRLQRIADGV